MLYEVITAYARSNFDASAILANDTVILRDASDPDKLGHYPCVAFQDEASGATVLFCGNLYNRDELQRKLGSSSDNVAQLICNLYLQKGEQFASMLIGTFAIVVYQPAENKLLLVRDSYNFV